MVRLNTGLGLAIGFIVCFVSCTNSKKMANKSLQIIMNTEASQQEFIKAVESIDNSIATIHFWNEIANNLNYKLSYRKHCILQLFKRNAVLDMPLEEFIQLFLNEDWFKNSQLTNIEILRGKLPVKMGIDRSVFEIIVLHEKGQNKNDCLIYFSVEGNVSKNQVLTLLSGNEYSPGLGKRNLLEIGFAGNLFEEYNE